MKTLRRISRRGSVYLLILGTAMLVTVVGIGALCVARVSARTMSASSDWEEAGVLAMSATEQAISALNAAATASPTGWRSAYTNNVAGFQSSAGRKNFSWIPIDEADGNIANNYLDTIRVYGVGRVGGVTRVYSVVLYPSGAPLDVLRCACHAAGNIYVMGTAAASTGPYSSNGLIKVGDPGGVLGLGAVSATLNANIEAQSRNVTGSINGTQLVPAAVKTMPSSRVFSDYAAKATPIAAGNFSGNGVTLLAAGINPFGTANPDGVYLIQIPAGQNLTVKKLRLRGTMLISGTSSQSVDIGPELLCESARPDYPAIIISGVGTVNLNGDTKTLNETASVNLNPPGAPYKGVENTVNTDQYPTEICGLVHVIGSGIDVNVNDKFSIRGSLISAGTISTSGTTAINSDPNLMTTVPLGYGKGDQLIIYPGSYRWDSLP